MGAVELANNLVEGQIKTTRGRLEQVLKNETNIADLIVPWSVQHASDLLNRYRVKLDGYSACRAIRRRSGRVG